MEGKGRKETRREDEKEKEGIEDKHQEEKRGCDCCGRVMKEAEGKNKEAETLKRPRIMN